MDALVIDDSAVTRRCIRGYLEQLGFAVREAADGRAAQALLSTSKPAALVVVDWHMPEVSGIELVRVLRGDHGFDSMRVLMVTTEHEKQSVIAALSAGADEFLMKPFTREMLRDKLALLGFDVADA